MSISKKKISAAAIAALVALTLTSCGSEEAAACPQVKEGVLTIATDEPVYGPWFDNNDPANGKGYEGAVAYAVAEELGYSKDQVEWVRVPFNNVVAPGCRNFDFDINEFSITPERAKELAQICALNALAAVQLVADVNKITKVVRVVGYVNGVTGFVNHPAVVNGASELFLAIWGDGAKHARSAVGIAELPLNSPVEIELTVEITD